LVGRRRWSPGGVVADKGPSTEGGRSMRPWSVQDILMSQLETFTRYKIYIIASVWEYQFDYTLAPQNNKVLKSMFAITRSC